MKKLLCILLSACSASTVGLEVVVDLPSENSDAFPYVGVETLELSITRSGETSPIASVQVALGDPLLLSEIPFGDDLSVHLSGRIGGSEVAYGRTCNMSVRDAGGILSPHLFFSKIVRWAAGPTLHTGRAVNALSVAIPPYALIVGGGETGVVDVVNGLSLDNSETLGSILERPISIRSGATLSVFDEGALIVGGQNSEGKLVALVEHIRPGKANIGRSLIELDGPGIVEHSAIELQNGTVLVTGGKVESTPRGDLVLANSAWQFSLVGRDIVSREISPGLRIPRSKHSMTRLGAEVGADVLIVGGLGADGIAVSESELYRPLGTKFDTLASAQLLTARYDHKAIRLPGGLVLIIGGMHLDSGSGTLSPVREMEFYDPALGRFSQAGTLPSGAGVVNMTVTELGDGRFMLAGGNDIDGTPVSAVFIVRYDPIGGVVDFSPTDSLSLPRAKHTAVLLCDGTVLVAGGTGRSDTDSERYNPPSSGRR